MKLLLNDKEIARFLIELIDVPEACKKIELNRNGSGFKKARVIINEYKLDTSHFDNGISKKTKHLLLNKECPVCNKKFRTKINCKEERKTCSYSCSNTYFRSGLSNPNWKQDSYRTTCFLYHKKECIICSETKIVSVHHFDENHENNLPENLIPLCPTHHQYVHSRYKDDVMAKIIEYRNKYIKK